MYYNIMAPNAMHHKIMIMTLQLIICKNAINNGWSMRRINEKQIEFTRKYNNMEECNKLCDEFLTFL